MDYKKPIETKDHIESINNNIDVGDNIEGLETTIDAIQALDLLKEKPSENKGAGSGKKKDNNKTEEEKNGTSYFPDTKINKLPSDKIMVSKIRNRFKQDLKKLLAQAKYTTKDIKKGKAYELNKLISDIRKIKIALNQLAYKTKDYIYALYARLFNIKH